jgi:hypothetical protein
MILKRMESPKYEKILALATKVFGKGTDLRVIPCDREVEQPGSSFVFSYLSPVVGNTSR